MDNLTKLQARKAALQGQIEQQRTDIKKTLLELRAELEPSRLLKKALSGALGISSNKAESPSNDMLGRLPAPLAFLVDLLVKDPKWALGLKLIAPLALRYWPKAKPKEEPAPKALNDAPESAPKDNLYGRLRVGITTLRKQLRKTKKTPEQSPETPEN